MKKRKRDPILWGDPKAKKPRGRIIAKPGELKIIPARRGSNR